MPDNASRLREVGLWPREHEEQLLCLIHPLDCRSTPPLASVSQCTLRSWKTQFREPVITERVLSFALIHHRSVLHADAPPRICQCGLRWLSTRLSASFLGSVSFLWLGCAAPFQISSHTISSDALPLRVPDNGAESSPNGARPRGRGVEFPFRATCKPASGPCPLFAVPFLSLHGILHDG